MITQHISSSVFCQIVLFVFENIIAIIDISVEAKSDNPTTIDQDPFLQVSDVIFTGHIIIWFESVLKGAG